MLQRTQAFSFGKTPALRDSDDSSSSDSDSDDHDLKVTWNDCSDVDSIGNVTSLHPHYMSLGEDTLMNAEGFVSREITDGSFSMTITAGDILSQGPYTGQICEKNTFKITGFGHTIGTLTWPGLNCPVTAGKGTFGFSLLLLPNIPGYLRSTQVTVTATDKTTGRPLVCLQIGTEPNDSNDN